MEIAPFLLALLVLWVVCIVTALRLLETKRLAKKQKRMPLPVVPCPVSVVIAVHNQAHLLKESLPVFLNQDYAEKYEVIVADKNSDDETSDLLEQYAETYPHLHVSKIPQTARDISLQRLALTLGLRSASHEWIAFVHPECIPTSDQWLTHFARFCNEQEDAIVGFASYEEVKGENNFRCRIHKLWNQMHWMPYCRRHAPYYTDGCCFLYRKSYFLEHQGFASSSNLLAGAETLLVNHHIARGRCYPNLDPQAVLHQRIPSSREWKQERIFYMETRRWMRHSFLSRTRYLIESTSTLLYPLLTIALLVWFCPVVVTCTILLAMWFLRICVRAICFHQVESELGIGHHWPLTFMESLIPLWDFQAWVKHLFTSKNTFRKKFV